jgi:hypothetical protein
MRSVASMYAAAVAAILLTAISATAEGMPDANSKSELTILRHWAVSTDLSPLDGSPRVAFTLIGVSPNTRLPILSLVYASEEWYVMLLGEGLSKGARRVRVRWDLSDFEMEVWQSSADGNAVLSPNPREFVKKITRAETLYVNFEGRSIQRSAEFDVSGFLNKLKTLPDVQKSLEPKNGRRLPLWANNGGPISGVR